MVRVVDQTIDVKSFVFAAETPEDAILSTAYHLAGFVLTSVGKPAGALSLET